MSYEKMLEYWQGMTFQSVAEFEKVLNHFFILFAYHSGKIENEQVTYSDTYDIFKYETVSHYSGSPQPLLQQQNQKLCFDFLNIKS